MPQGDYDGLFSAANQGIRQINLGILHGIARNHS